MRSDTRTFMSRATDISVLNSMAAVPRPRVSEATGKEEHSEGVLVSGSHTVEPFLGDISYSF